jgi:hypothetical protein
MALIVLKWLGLIVIVVASARARLWHRPSHRRANHAIHQHRHRCEWMLITSACDHGSPFLPPHVGGYCYLAGKYMKWSQAIMRPVT